MRCMGLVALGLLGDRGEVGGGQVVAAGAPRPARHLLSALYLGICLYRELHEHLKVSWSDVRKCCSGQPPASTPAHSKL